MRPLLGMATDSTIATEILNQLGGRMLLAMTGTKTLLYGDRDLTAKLGGGARTARGTVTHLRVTLDASDTYTVEALRVRAGNCIVVESMEGIYNDMLRRVGEKLTGFSFSL